MCLEKLTRRQCTAPPMEVYRTQKRPIFTTYIFLAHGTRKSLSEVFILYGFFFLSSLLARRALSTANSLSCSQIKFPCAAICFACRATYNLAEKNPRIYMRIPDLSALLLLSRNPRGPGPFQRTVAPTY